MPAAARRLDEGAHEPGSPSTRRASGPTTRRRRCSRPPRYSRGGCETRESAAQPTTGRRARRRDVPPAGELASKEPTGRLGLEVAIAGCDALGPDLRDPRPVGLRHLPQHRPRIIPEAEHRLRRSWTCAAPTAARSLPSRSAPTKMAQMSATDKIDVSIEHKQADPDEADDEEAPEHLPRLRFPLPRRRAASPPARVPAVRPPLPRARPRADRAARRPRHVRRGRDRAAVGRPARRSSTSSPTPSASRRRRSRPASATR